MSDVLERVKKIVVENLDVEGDKVVESASFIDDLGADSLDLVELVSEFMNDDIHSVIGIAGAGEDALPRENDRPG